MTDLEPFIPEKRIIYTAWEGHKARSVTVLVSASLTTPGTVSPRGEEHYTTRLQDKAVAIGVTPEDRRKSANAKAHRLSRSITASVNPALGEVYGTHRTLEDFVRAYFVAHPQVLAQLPLVERGTRKGSVNAAQREHFKATGEVPFGLFYKGTALRPRWYQRLYALDARGLGPVHAWIGGLPATLSVDVPEDVTSTVLPAGGVTTASSSGPSTSTTDPGPGPESFGATVQNAAGAAATVVSENKLAVGIAAAILALLVVVAVVVMRRG